jgi:cytoskeletal protein RodZ
MKNLRFVFVIILFFTGFFLSVLFSQVFPQDEPTDDPVVAEEPAVQADNGIVDAGTDEVTVDSQKETVSPDIAQDKSDDNADSEESADKKKPGGDEEKPQEQSKNLYERRGRLPPVPRN